MVDKMQVLALGSPTVQVRSVDHGGLESVRRDQLRPLPAELLKVQMFATRCHLVGLQPAGDITRWSRTSVDRFRTMVRSGPCFVKVKVGQRP